MLPTALFSFALIWLAHGRPNTMRSTLDVRSTFDVLSAFDVRSALDAPPPGFKEAGVRSQSSQSLRLTIGLSRSNITGLRDALMDVSDPDSPNYGNYWSQEKVRSCVHSRIRSLRSFHIDSGPRLPKARDGSDRRRLA